MPRRSVTQSSLRFLLLLLVVAACSTPGPPGWTFTPIETPSGPGAQPSPAATTVPAATAMPTPAPSSAPMASMPGADGAMASPGSSDGGGVPILGTLEVRAFDIGYEPTTLTVDRPGRYLVRFVNTGELAHDIMFADGTMVDAAAGTTAEGELVVPTGGLTFVCTRPGHAQVGQQGTLLVGG